MKVIIKVDPETGEVESFVWDRPGKPPPLIRPKIKKKRPENDFKKRNPKYS